MTSRLFLSFCEMIDQIPVKAVLKAADAERRMLEDDIAAKRISRNAEAESILAFCDFLRCAANDLPIAFPELPVEHCGFYRRTVVRLVEAGELPVRIEQEFDTTFFRSLTKALHPAV